MNQAPSSFPVTSDVPLEDNLDKSIYSINDQANKNRKIQCNIINLDEMNYEEPSLSPTLHDEQANNLLPSLIHNIFQNLILSSKVKLNASLKNTSITYFPTKVIQSDDNSLENSILPTIASSSSPSYRQSVFPSKKTLAITPSIDSSSKSSSPTNVIQFHIDPVDESIHSTITTSSSPSYQQSIFQSKKIMSTPRINAPSKSPSSTNVLQSDDDILPTITSSSSPPTSHQSILPSTKKLITVVPIINSYAPSSSSSAYSNFASLPLTSKRNESESSADSSISSSNKEVISNLTFDIFNEWNETTSSNSSNVETYTPSTPKANTKIDSNDDKEYSKYVPQTQGSKNQDSSNVNRVDKKENKNEKKKSLTIAGLVSAFGITLFIVFGMLSRRQSYE